MEVWKKVGGKKVRGLERLEKWGWAENRVNARLIIEDLSYSLKKSVGKL